jgi:hypothetical protein
MIDRQPPGAVVDGSFTGKAGKEPEKRKKNGKGSE